MERRISLGEHQFDKDLRKSEILTHEDTLKLFKDLHKNPQAVTEKLIKANIKFVFSVANKYRGRGIDLADLVQEGNRGLLRALESYDPTRGIKFMSYAVYWIRQHIENYIDENQTVRIPQNIKVKEKQVIRRFGRDATLQEIEDNFDFGTENSRHIFESIHQRHDSLDTPVSSSTDETGTRTLLDILPDTHDMSTDDQVELRDELDSALSTLTVLERQIMGILYPLEDEGNTELYLTDVAKAIEVPVERVRIIRKRALEKLRKEITLRRKL